MNFSTAEASPVSPEPAVGGIDPNLYLFISITFHYIFLNLIQHLIELIINLHILTIFTYIHNEDFE